MTQVVLQTCATVDEALALLRAVRVWFPANFRGLTLEGSHWLLADATGKAVVVEWTPVDHQLLVYDKPGPYELMTNLSFQEGEEFLAKTCPRYAQSQAAARTGRQRHDRHARGHEGDARHRPRPLALDFGHGPERTLLRSSVLQGIRSEVRIQVFARRRTGLALGMVLDYGPCYAEPHAAADRGPHSGFRGLQSIRRAAAAELLRSPRRGDTP